MIRPRVHRLRQVAHGAVVLTASWYGMMAVHELGHVVGAWATGGTVRRVVLHPLEISRTELRTNPRPLVVAWAGPAVGVLVPLAASAAAQAARFGHTPLLQFFAGFCLVANGVYIGGGSFAGIGDGGDLLRHGAARWQLWMFGGIATTTGLYVWHLLGLRRAPAETESRA